LTFGQGGDRMKRRHVYLGTAALTAGVLLLTAGFWLGRASRPEEDVARSTRRTIYVIQEFSWRLRARGDPLVLDDGRPGRPVKAFVERGRADAHCQQLNLQKRATANPFRYTPEATSGSSLDQYTTLSEAAFLALLRAEGLATPVLSLRPSTDYDDQVRVWADWWEEHRKEWDDRLVELLWSALDRLCFYEVVEVAVEP
jgi:hypothetical protein